MSQTVTGYAAKWQSLSVDLGGFREKIQRGAFAKSIRSEDILALHHHNGSAVLGRTSNGSLSLVEDAIGLRFSLVLPNTSLGTDIAELARRRDIKGMSFGFYVDNPDGEKWERSGTQIVRTLLDVRIFEISSTASPAYRATSIGVASRSSNPEANAAAARMREKLRERGAAV